MGTFKKQGANSVKSSKRRRQPRAKLEKKILKLWKTNRTLFQIAAIVGCRQPTVKQIFIERYGKLEVRQRSKKLYRLSKLNYKNPMFNKTFEKHHNWKGSSLDHKGYRTVVKPIWWTGLQKHRIFEHHYIYALHNNLTTIPQNYCIHHLDGDGLNNNITNLQMLTNSEHIKLHWKLKKCVTTISKESTIK